MEFFFSHHIAPSLEIKFQITLKSPTGIVIRGFYYPLVADTVLFFSIFIGACLGLMVGLRSSRAPSTPDDRHS